MPQSEAEPLATRILLWYLQCNGSTAEQKVNILNEMAAFCGIRAKFIQDETRSGWETEDADEAHGRLAIELRQKLKDMFPMGDANKEIYAIAGMLMEYREKAKNL